MKKNSRKTSIAWRVWSILLCLVMMLGVLPTLALADGAPEMETTELSITKTVKLGGNTAPGQQGFELEIFDAGVSGDYDDIYTAAVHTNGAGTYVGKLIISGSQAKVRNLVCEGFFVREKNTGKTN